ncbi:MAG TPA: pyruvate, phosphate dikinase [Thermoleophilaceae bacterium]|nr:pyruvate, phosphate dikinase [Thermoleophilaceae bacterium]
MAAKLVYDFEEGSREMRELLGGKGANVAEMTRVLGADRVPAGFTITTEACVTYLTRGEVPDLAEPLARLEGKTGKRLGDLLVSVRSGARESMPGMLDTILNLGLNDETVERLARATGNERFAWDSYRRFVQMFGNVAKGVPGERIEELIAEHKRAAGVKLDSELRVVELQLLTAELKGLYEFPEDPLEQLDAAVRAVFDSWKGERAAAYRRLNRIPYTWGTAVNVQQMVFGNRGETSCSGVAFSRDELTGAPEPSGDFLVNAQGEDVVSGVRTPHDLSEMKQLMPKAHAELLGILSELERHYGDMQDTEFTVEEGRLFMLQTRNAKRPAQAAVRFAVDAVAEGLLSREEALLSVDAGALEALLHPTFSPEADFDVLVRGVNASPGAAKGAIVFTAGAAVESEGDVVLVRPFTEAEDIAGFDAARGILTSEGGKASHAALVARGMGRPCVCGASDLEVDLVAKEMRVNGTVLREGDLIALDGTSGIVTTDDVPLIDPEVDESFQQVLAWSDELRRLGVRANADTPEEARKARELGAEGIGLCRTEHMFMAADRQPLMRAMIMADGEEERRRALDELLPLQQADFEGLFEEMAGLPVCIRLLDPPLHEFLPHPEELEGAERERAEALRETNPMLGTRGCRLHILYPEIPRMQVRAIARAARSVDAHVEVMVPLVAYEAELKLLRALIEEEVGEGMSVGTMIELPRACFVADRIADQADFFSFGTNDLTQTALGFSRDDVEGRFLAKYIDRGIVDRSPFETLDTAGVGWLVRLAAWTGRESKPGLKLGVCGEHGGDPDSVAFFDLAGVDYVSCSPYRVPIARVAAAQAAVRAVSGSGDSSEA